MDSHELTQADTDDRKSRTGIRCPDCGSGLCRVYTTRKYYWGVKRYQECQHCGRKFSSTEKVG